MVTRSCGSQRLRSGRPEASQRDAFVLGQHLGQVPVIQALVLDFGQLDNSSRQGGINDVVRRSASVAVRQAGHSLFAEGPVQPLELPLGDSEKLGCAQR